MKLEKLLKDYELASVQEYYDMIIESVTNGQVSQAKVQFLQLSKEDRVEFLRKLAKDIYHPEETSVRLLYSTLMICLNVIY